MDILLDKVYTRDGDVVSRKIAGELFLVPVKGKLAHMEQIFTLTSVAEFIWENINGKKSLHDIYNDLIDQFDVGHDEAESDLREFVADLLKAGLIWERAV